MTIFEFNLLGITIAPTYYGLMYALGFIGGYWIIKTRITGIFSPNLLYRLFSGKKVSKKQKNKLAPKSKYKIGDFMDSLLFYIFFGVVIGGRLGYIIFYNFSQYLSDPLSIFKVWEGGMSFHGGVIGVVIAMWLFSKKHKINYYSLADQVTAILPLGIGFGRIGNYLNKELLGFGEYFGPLAVKTNTGSYFPSPLVEFLLEGVVLFIILNIAIRKKQFEGQIAALFLIFYGIFRIIVEVFFRTPDEHIGYIYGFLTLGVIYSIPMILAGIYFYITLKNAK
ncbi:prolipoprotein diacylglyceryl transferase [Candidatus Gracilibacteria bacterium]|nr:prolipoprotein diacylglyceryl transferase [Candidatus Gracilibacteria bacterium]